MEKGTPGFQGFLSMFLKEVYFVILYYLTGFIGIIIAAIMLGIEIDGSTFLTRFILKLIGMSFFVGSIWLIRSKQRRMAKNKDDE
ncbi:hypothetical protein R0K30_02500 [Bacillus sp. SIMBA_154]|uniref:hypothetical protein n=1 Tax=Bacillus sp. SIMBA_154 TaxID=3080859 RepID=UPI00397E6441